MMDNLTMYVNKQNYKIEIDEKFTKMASLEDIEDLELSVPGFFDVETLYKENNKIFLDFHIPNGYKSFVEAKGYDRLIKMQLIQRLLEIDPLSNCDKTFLDPNNIFLRDFQDIKLLYRSNGLLPFDDKENIEQYKLFTLGFISEKFGYKQYLLQKETLLIKDNDEFMFKVNAAETFNDLKSVIEKEVIEVRSKYYEKLQSSINAKKKGKRRKIIMVATAIIITSMLAIAGLKQAENKVSSRYKNDMESIKLENKILETTQSGDTEKAIKLMEKNGDSSLEIAKMLLSVGKYDEAIKYDKKVESKVVEKLYELNQQEKVLSLKSNSSFMKTEKDIVKYDTDILDPQVTLITNKGTLKRLGLTYVQNNNVLMAKEVQSVLKDKELKDYIKKAELENKITKINNDVFKLQGKDDEKDTAEIKALQEKSLELQKELIQLEEKMGIDTK